LSVLEDEDGLVGDVEKDEVAVDVADCAAEALADHAVPGGPEGAIHVGLDL